MKRFGKIILCVLLVVAIGAAAFSPISTEAGPRVSQPGSNTGAGNQGTGRGKSQYIPLSNQGAGNQSTGGGKNNYIPGSNSGGATDGPKTAGCISSWPPFIHINACFANIIYLIMWFISWVLWLAGKILDLSVFYTLNMADLLTHVPVVDIGWRIFRDLANICFIFILLWIALGTILGLQSGKTKELLVHLIIVALLMNFSLFITKVVVDSSNIVALHFYHLIVAPPPSTKAGDGPQIELRNILASATGSFSGAFMEGLKIQTLYKASSAVGQNLENDAGGIVASTLVGGALNFGKIILVGIFGSIFMIMAAYVFFVAAILFIVRVVSLMLIMILSPIAFISFILPSTEKYAEKWMETLISQSMFAPIYLALCYVVVKTIQSPAFQGAIAIPSGGDTLASVFTTGSTGGLAMIFNFVILIALMLASILVAKKMEAFGHETAIEWGKNARGFVGRHIMRGTPIVAGAAAGKWFMEKGSGAASRLGLEGASKKLGDWAKAVDTNKLRKKVDINELDKKFKGSTFGTTVFGDFVREKTTGGTLFGTGAKFGGEKSVKESYEEDEHLKDKAREVFLANEVKKAAAELNQPIPVSTPADLLARRPAVLPDVRNPDGTMRPMTEAEWISSEQKRERGEVEKSRLNAVQSAVVRLPTTGLVHLQEEVIKTVIPHATEKQVDELMKSTEGGWTQHDKEEFLEIYFDQLKKDGEAVQAQMDQYATELAEFENKVRSGLIQIDQATGKVVKDTMGRAVGTAPNTTYAIPQYDEQSDAHKAVYAKTRRYMSLKGFELLNITKFHFSDATRIRLEAEGKNPDETNILRAIPAIGKIMKWSTSQDIRDPNKTSNFTDQERVDIRYIKDASLVEILNKLRGKKDPTSPTGEYMYRNTDAERAEALRTGNFALLAKDNLWEERVREFLRGRAPIETANTPGGMREQYEYARFLGAEALREFAKKDPIDVIKLLENAFQALKDNEEGKRIINPETKQLIKDLITTKEGWRIGQKMKNPAFQKMREDMEVAFREHKQDVQFTDWTKMDPAERTAAYRKAEQARARGGWTPPEPGDNQPPTGNPTPTGGTTGGPSGGGRRYPPASPGSMI